MSNNVKGKERKVYFLSSKNVKKVVQKKLQLRKEAKGTDKQKVTESSIVDNHLNSLS